MYGLLRLLVMFLYRAYMNHYLACFKVKWETIHWKTFFFQSWYKMTNAFLASTILLCDWTKDTQCANKRDTNRPAKVRWLQSKPHDNRVVAYPNTRLKFLSQIWLESTKINCLAAEVANFHWTESSRRICLLPPALLTSLQKSLVSRYLLWSLSLETNAASLRS